MGDSLAFARKALERLFESQRQSHRHMELDFADVAPSHRWAEMHQVKAVIAPDTWKVGLR